MSIYAAETDDFELGKKSFNNKNYNKALEHFENTIKVSPDSISLTYNIAVTHFKLENYDRSQFYFNKIVNNPKMTSLVEYNLGLIELKLNNKDKAKDLFTKVYNNTTKTKLKSLSKKQLKKLNYTVKKRESKKLKSSVWVATGYTDNVSSISTGTASGKADSFNIYAAYVKGALSNTLNRGLTAKLRYYTLLYSVENQFDFSELELNTSYNFLEGRYKSNVTLLIKKSDLGGKSYQSTTGVDAKFRNRLSKGNYLTVRARLENITDDSKIYTYLEGSRQRFRINYRIINKNHTNRFWYQYELNDRKDTFLTSYSPQRHFLRYTYKLRFSGSWKLNAGVGYRKSNYPDKPTKTREDDRLRYLLSVENKFASNWYVRGGYEYRDNQSTDKKYTYIRNVYFVNVKWRY
jgi:Tfp pilus assembly protein PilF